MMGCPVEEPMGFGMWLMWLCVTVVLLATYALIGKATHEHLDRTSEHPEAIDTLFAMWFPIYWTVVWCLGLGED